MASQESQHIRAVLRSQKEAEKNHPPLSIAQQRQDLESLSRGLPPDAGIAVRSTTAGTVPGEWLIPSEGTGSRVILYLHGGAYYRGSCSTHRDLAGRLALASDSRVLVTGYRLAPQ